MSLKAIWANNTPYSKFLIAVAAILLGGAVSTLICAGLATVIFGVSITDLETLLNDLDNPLALSIMKFIQTVTTIGTFIVPAFVIGWLFDTSAFSYLKLSRKASFISVILVFVLLMSAIPLINFLGDLNSKMTFPSWLAGLEAWMRDSEDKAAKITEKFLVINTPFDFAYIFIIVAVLPALGEELIFRGVIQRLFSDWSGSVHSGVWTSAILFSTMHMQFYGFIPRVLLGVMLGYLLVWSGSLWLPIIAHFINNGAAVIFIYLYKHEMIGVDADKIGTENDYMILLISTVITGLFLWLIYRREMRLKTTTAFTDDPRSSSS